MTVKQISSKIETKATEDGGRSVKLTLKNRDSVIAWLGLAYSPGLLTKKNANKVRVKTPKGIRVADVDDVIVKYGTRRNGGIPTFKVEKA